MELRWKTKNGSCIFGGVPIEHTGKETGLLIRLDLLKNLEIGKAILSVGCGTGAELLLLKKRGFVTLGLDPVRSFLLEGKTRSNADCFIQAVGEKTPLSNGSFDLVLLFEVLEHVMKPEAVLKEIKRLLKPNGILFLTVPNKFYPFETHGIQICKKQIENLLGIGIPFFSLAPGFLRRRFERARIYSETEISSLLRRHFFEPHIVEYAMPTLDIRQQTPLAKAVRQVSIQLGKAPMIKRLGPNLLVISKKVRNG